MPTEPLWARWNEARDLFDTDLEKTTTILLSLIEEDLPVELHIRTYLLLASATSDWFKAEEYLKTAEETWGALRTTYAFRSPENETILELRKELDQLKQWQKEDIPSIVSNMMLGAIREEAEDWEREDTREAVDPEFQAHVRRLEALEAGEGEPDGEQSDEREHDGGESGEGESADREAGTTSELPIR